jgi:hypothetical protein
MRRKFTIGQRQKGKNKKIKQFTAPTINLFNITTTIEDTNSINKNNNQTLPVEETPSLMEYIKNNDEATQSPLPPNAKRIAIAYLFKQLGAPWSEHGSHDCITAIIHRNLLISAGNDVSSVLQEYLDCRTGGTQYTDSFSKKFGCPTILEITGTEAQLCANTQEDGLSITMSWTAINQQCQEADLPSITKAAVIGLVNKLRPKVIKLK